jgi:neutral ceramidase
MNFKIGLGKQDMTAFIPGVGMMGYGQFHNFVKEVATPLMARVLILKQNDKQFILAHLEQAFVTLAIKEEVLKRINLKFPEWKMDDSSLAVTAQHTHSAPGGFSHYPFYNFTIPDFQTRVFDKIVSAIMNGIEEANRNFQDVTLSWGKTDISPDKEIAFNRSMTAQALNPEAKYFTEDEKHLAVDRTMEGMFFKTNEGKTIAFLNWFGVHCTSVSSFNTRIHHDNKGVAASLFEKNHPGVTAFFLQATAGDVSPNFIWDKKTKLMRGKFTDQYENASFNGELQFREAEKISSSHEIGNEFSFFHCFMDMSLEVAPPAHGVAFFQGTLEGPGVDPKLGAILKKVSRMVKMHKLSKSPEENKKFYEAHGHKDVLLDHRTGAFLGIPVAAWKKLPPLPEPSVEAFRKTAKRNALETLPWVPTILPFQILRLGNVVIAFTPGEITGVAGKRLKDRLLNELNPLGIKEIFLTSYANAFMGYVVTPEEYDKQCYEGGHTIYGRNTLGGIMKGFDYVVKKMKGEKVTNLPVAPFHFPADELARRSV